MTLQKAVQERMGLSVSWNRDTKERDFEGGVYFWDDPTERSLPLAGRGTV
jgi:hypothetical protein